MPTPRTPSLEEWFQSFELDPDGEVRLVTEDGVESANITENMTIEQRQQEALNTSNNKIKLAL